MTRWTEADLAAHQAKRGGKVVSSDRKDLPPSPGRPYVPARSTGDSGQTIVVVLPGEPRGKGRPRSRIATGRGGQQFIAVYTPQETRAYERALAIAGKMAMGARPPLDGPLEVAIVAVMGVPASWSGKKRDAALAGVVRPTGRPDLDNLGKSALDGLAEIVFHNDSQVVRATIEKRYGEEPMMRIEVKAVGAFDAA